MKAGNGYSAYLPDLPGCIAAGDTFEETSRLIHEAAVFHLEGRPSAWDMERDNEASGDRKGKAEMKYTVIIERGPTSYGAYIPDLPGCVAAGDTREEVESLITEAVADHIELMAEHGETIPKPASTAIEVEVQPSSALEKLAVEAGR